MDSSTALPATASAMAAPAQGRLRPAWREPLVWLVVGIPALTVIAGIATLVIATRGADMLVSDDIRKQGLAISHLLERDDAARRFGLAADLTISKRGAIVLRLEGDRLAFASTLELRLLDPAKANADLHITLSASPANPGLYTGQSDSALVASRAWLASIESGQWRLVRRGVTQIVNEEPIGFEAKPSTRSAAQHRSGSAQ